MLRLSWIAVVLASCAHAVSEPNPPTAPPALGPPYAGRIVLETSALRDEVDDFAQAWTQRLAILGATAKITYDDARGVIDVYGIAATELDRVARILADPGAYDLDGMRFDGEVITWIAPDAYCNCSGRVRVMLDENVMCALANGTHELRRMGVLAAMRTTRYWHIEGSSRYHDQPPEPGGCRGKDYWLTNMVFELPAGASRETNVGTVLALGGGTLPAVPRIASIAPAGAAVATSTAGGVP